MGTFYYCDECYNYGPNLKEATYISEECVVDGRTIEVDFCDECYEKYQKELKEKKQSLVAEKIDC